MICCLRLRARGRVLYIKHSVAGVAELADARDSKSRFLRSVGSIPTAGSFFNTPYLLIPANDGSVGSLLGSLFRFGLKQ